MVEVYSAMLASAYLEQNERGQIFYYPHWLPPIEITSDLLRDMAAMGNVHAQAFLRERENAENQPA